jgi:hypothetical protein
MTRSSDRLDRSTYTGRGRPAAVSTTAGIALACFFPLTAVLHHAFFYNPTCILNNFGQDYTLRVVMLWLRSDPSPWLALLGAMGTFALSLYSPAFRLAALAFAIATIPLSLWIWDIPFTGRIICRLGHDGRSPVNTHDLYIFAAIAFAPIWYWLWRRSTVVPARTAGAWSRP